MVIALLLSMVVGLALAYIDYHPSLRANTPPTYVQQVIAYKEGARAFTIYFILADQESNQTTADGTANLSMSENGTLLYSKSVNVSEEDFERVTEGTGGFDSNAIAYNFGRISYDTFDKQPTGSSGDVRVTFTTSDGTAFDGEASVIFDK